MKRIAALYRASYSGLSPASWWLCFVMLINRSGTMVVPFMTLYLTQRLGYSISQAGIVFAVYGLGAICGGFLGGRLADHFGFYRIQILALAGGGLLFFLLGQMHSFLLICVVTFILALVNDAFRPANALAIAHYSKPENLTRSYSLNRLSTNLGWALGGSLGGFIAAHNYAWLFILDGFSNLFAALLLRLVLAPARQDRLAHASQPKARRFEVFRDRKYLLFAVLVSLFAFVFFQLFSTLPVYYRSVLKLSEEVIGGTMAANGLIIALFEMVLVFRLEGRRQPLQYIPVGTLLVALAFLLLNLGLPALLLAALCTLIIALGEMLAMPFMNTYWVSRSCDANRGQYAGVYTASWATAQVLGPALGSSFADTLGFQALWWLIVSIALTAAIGFWLLHRSTKRAHNLSTGTK
ncbi:MAG: MFS transporter [Bacteroidetes bacterium]|nr:MFS transporter [Bacteroidota bacterium]